MEPITTYPSEHTQLVCRTVMCRLMRHLLVKQIKKWINKYKLTSRSNKLCLLHYFHLISECTFNEMRFRNTAFSAWFKAVENNRCLLMPAITCHFSVFTLGESPKSGPCTPHSALTTLTLATPVSNLWTAVGLGFLLPVWTWSKT